MALPRPSNDGILILSVLVGALGLGANHFMQLDPRVIAALMPAPVATVEQAPNVANEPPPKPLPDSNDDAPLPIGLTMPELARLEEQIKAVHDRWEKYGHVPRDYRDSFPQIAARAMFLKRQVAASPNADENRKRTARLSALSIAFFAAEMQPKAVDVFQQLSGEILNECTSQTDCARTVVLQILILHDFENPHEQKLLSDLTRFSDEYESVSNGIFMYQTVAKKLDGNGFRELSNRVLQQGILRYRKDGSKVNRLINDLISQGGEIPRS